MSEKTAKYSKLLKSNIDRVIIAVMYSLLLVLVWLWMSEQSMDDPPEGEKVVTIEDVVDKNAATKQVVEMGRPQAIENDPAILQVSRFNMFDYKSVKERDKIEKEANQRIVQVEELLKQKRNDDAKRLLEEVLKVIPAHQKARQLLDQINKAATPAAPGTAPAAGAPPAPGTAAAPAAGATPTPAI